MPTFRDEDVPLEKLLLDPNNYRFHDDPEFLTAEPTRLHEESVQDRAYRRLRDGGLVQLKNSILKNGFLPVERIVVRDYNRGEGAFIVVEGNRRVAALLWIRKDHDAGVSIPEQVLRTIEAVPVLVVDATEGDAGSSRRLWVFATSQGSRNGVGFNALS